MIRIKDARPLYTGLFVTSERFKEDQIENGLIIYNKGEISPYQKVFRTGPYVKNVKEGDYVKINLGRYMRKKYTEDDLRSEMPVRNDVQVVIPEVVVDGVKYFHIDENDAVMVIADWEEVDTPKIHVMTPEIILPN